jgi:hypothetical protein
MRARGSVGTGILLANLLAAPMLQFSALAFLSHAGDCLFRSCARVTELLTTGKLLTYM